MPYNPCGFIVDITRRMHDEPCRFFNNSDRVDTVRFMEADPKAPTLPFWSVVYPAQNDPVRWPYDEIGTLNQRPFDFTGARCPLGLPFDHVCGTRAEFEFGATYDPDKPPNPIGANGLPLCCNPPKRVGGGAGVGGVASYRVFRPLVIASGAGVGGKAFYFSGAFVDPMAGGLAIGGAMGDVYRPPDAMAGGLELGGEMGDVYTVTSGSWERTANGDYTFTATFTGDHQIECWGIGGLGEGEYIGGKGGGGGGGGGYARSVLALVAGTDYSVHIGGNPLDRDVWFNASTVLARSGIDGGAGAGGLGGGNAGGFNVGDVTFNGGNAGSGSLLAGDGGGGGGGAGANAGGTNAVGRVAGSGGGDGGNGGDGGTAPGGDGTDGTGPGGGGGAGATGGGGGSAAGFGRVRIIWPPPP